MRTQEFSSPTNRTPAEIRDDAHLWQKERFPAHAVQRIRDAADQIEILQAALREARFFIQPITINSSYPIWSERYLIGKDAKKVMRNIDLALMGRRLYASEEKVSKKEDQQEVEHAIG